MMVRKNSNQAQDDIQRSGHCVTPTTCYKILFQMGA